MRGKFPRHHLPARRLRLPSMRPAHYAREVGFGRAKHAEVAVPSMRPAHYAREVSAMEFRVPSAFVLQ